MFDFAKLAINSKKYAAELKENPLLYFTTAVNEKNGDLKDNIHTAEYQDLKFIIYPSDRIEIKGSLHKFKNFGGHNHDDFNIKMVRDTIMDFQTKFNLDPNLVHVHSLEVGMNINTSFNPNVAINGLIAYKNNSFKKMSMINKGNGKEVGFQRFKIKIYNKGVQHSLIDHILRIEKKFFKMVGIRPGAIYLSDLYSQDFAAFCLQDLINTFSDLIIYEKVNRDILTIPQLKMYEFCSNPRNWEEMSRKQRHRYKSGITEITQKHGIQNIQSSVINLLVEKRDLLLSQ